ncbi:MAG: tetratricopeptide repeat protein, partial [Saccharospirillum sp.]
LGRPTEAMAYNSIIRDANPEAYSAQQQYREAITAASRGDVLSAKNAFQDILNQFPANRNAGMMLGLLTLQNGEVAEGELLLSEHLDPETAPTTFVQAAALAQVELGRSREALDVLSTALLARPDDADLLGLYGALLLREGRNQLGVQTLNKALELEPNRSRLMLMLAQYYTEHDQPQLALGHLRKAYAINPADWLTTQFYVTTLVAEDEMEEAQRVANELTEAFPEAPQPYWISSMLDYRQGNTSRALIQMTSLLEDHPEFTDAYPATAQLMRQQGQTLAATDLLMRGYRAIPERPDLLEAALQWRTETTSDTDTLNWLLEQAANSPQDVALQLNSVAMNRLLAQGDFARAGELAAQYQGFDHAPARAMTGQYFRVRAQQAASQGNWADAGRWIEQAEQRQPQDLQTQFLAAQIENSQGRTEDARARLDALLASRPDNQSIVAQKARLMAANNERTAALAFLREYWNRSPSAELATIYVALVSELEQDRLLMALEQWHQVDPEAAAPWFMKGNYYLSQEADNDAITAYRETLSRDENHIAALNNLAWLLREDSPTEALDLAARAVGIAPENPGILDTYGWLLHLNGDHQQAVTVLTRARQLAPDNADIEQHLREAEESNGAPA